MSQILGSLIIVVKKRSIIKYRNVVNLQNNEYLYKYHGHLRMRVNKI